MTNQMDTVHNVYNLILEYLIKYGFQALIGLIIVLIGWKIAGWLSRFFINLCQKRHLDITLTKFLAMVLKVIVLTFTALIALDKFGITISPFIASISAMIFGASFALQAPLSNYAAGLSIIFTRPFVVGNTITIKGYNGVVEEVKLPCTILLTVDGERITIPNKDIVGEVIVNSLENKVAESVVGISYGDDPAKAIRVIGDTLKTIPQVASSPAAQVGIQALADSSINIGVRYWVPTMEYLKVVHATNLAIYNALKNSGVTIPFPQRDVHVISTNSESLKLSK